LCVHKYGILLTNVNIVRRIQPSPPPLGGGAGCPPPSGEGPGRGRRRARGAVARARRPRSQVMCIAAVYAMHMTVSREPTPSARGVGKPGFPTPRLREGLAFPQG